jgi:hypothetical protein|tara:strand:- start:4 stop:720 length:717 start_codon:yes stop_codon:yes gene_type:complete
MVDKAYIDRIMMTQTFNYIQRNHLYQNFKINEDLQIEEVVLTNGTKYYKVKNFFKYPGMALKNLLEWPVIKPPAYVYTPGGRQNFTPMDLVPIVTSYADIAGTINDKEYKPQSFITSSNVVPPNPDCWEGSWHPHTDHDMVFNLWLCDWTEGTGLYTYKGYKTSREYEGTPDQKLNRNKIVKWQNFTSGDDYELYHTIPCEFNTLTIYDGKLFHGTIMGEGTGERYSLISFYHPNENY